MANKKNLANGVLASPISNSATTATLESGHGSRMPAVPFFLTVTPERELSTVDNSEIWSVTGRSGDVLTITRAQKGTTAKAFNAGAIVAVGVYVEDIESIETDVASLQTSVSGKEPKAIEVSVTTAAATAAKVGTTSGGSYTPAYGDRINVSFTLGINVNNPTLNIDGSGAKNIRLGVTNVTTSLLGIASAAVVPMWYDGTYWQIYGSFHNTDTNTTYKAPATFSTVTGTTQAAAINTGYFANNAAQVNFTLPATAAIGDVVEIVGQGAGGWRATAASGDNIILEGDTTAAAGYVQGPQYTNVSLRCVVANTTWQVVGYTGKLTSSTGLVTNSYVNSSTTDRLTVGSTAPSSPATGDVWIDTNNLPEALAPTSIVWKENPTGTKNGSNTSFSASQAYISGSLQLFINGSAQSSFVTESSPTTGGFTVSPAPASTDNLSIQYQVRTTATGNADTVDSFHANSTPTANNLLPLDSNAKISGLVVSNVVQTQTNAGTAGGTINYVNEGGIKRAWGVTASYSVAGNANTNATITLPTSFFSSITGVSIAVGELTVDARQVAYINVAPTTTTLNPGVQGFTGSATAVTGKWYWEVRGT